MGAEETTDMGTGLAAILSLVAALGAAVTYLNPGNAVGGWGFALALLAASLAVVAIHLYA